MALALALTVCGGLWTFHASRHRGPAPATRGVALTLLPGAALLTGTLEMIGEVASSIADWAAGFVFSPLVWLGIAMFVLAVVLLGASSRMSGGERSAESEGESRDLGGSGDATELPRSAGKGTPMIDDDLSDIEAILRKRGIS
jgi:hypothetical protein